MAATQESQTPSPRDDGEAVLDSRDPANESQVILAGTADIPHHATHWPLPPSNQATPLDHMNTSSLVSTVAASLDCAEDFQQPQIYSTYDTRHHQHHAPILHNSAFWPVPVQESPCYYTLPRQLLFSPSIPDPNGGSTMSYMYESSIYVRAAENRSVPSSSWCC